jgi:hypothetical protein
VLHDVLPFGRAVVDINERKISEEGKYFLYSKSEKHIFSAPGLAHKVVLSWGSFSVETRGEDACPLDSLAQQEMVV